MIVKNKSIKVSQRRMFVPQQNFFFISLSANLFTAFVLFWLVAILTVQQFAMQTYKQNLNIFFFQGSQL